MFRRLKRWFQRRRAARLAPLAARLATPGEWTKDDAQALRGFLETETGKRFRGLLWQAVTEQALRTRDVPCFERGAAAGQVRTLESIEGMAETEEEPATEE